MSQYYAIKRFLRHRSFRFLFFCLISFAILNIVLFLSTGKVYSGQATLSWDPPTTNGAASTMYPIQYRLSVQKKPRVTPTRRNAPKAIKYQFLAIVHFRLHGLQVGIVTKCEIVVVTGPLVIEPELSVNSFTNVGVFS